MGRFSSWTRPPSRQATSSRSRFKTGLRLTAMSAACLVAAACQSSQSMDATSLNSLQAPGLSTNGQISPAVARWAVRFDANPHDITAALNLSRELRRERQYKNALGIMLRATTIAQDDPRIMAEMGKTLVERGSPEEGLSFLDRAAIKLPADWTIMSARGVALDQMEKYRNAQDAYQMALTYSPENPVVLANYGMSLALEGRLGEAETMLRRAVAHPEASGPVHLNLALILGLSGDFDGAERIARNYLEPATVEQNLTWLRSLLTQPARWQRPTDGDYEALEARQS